jgi:hypothetical protein
MTPNILIIKENIKLTGFPARSRTLLKLLMISGIARASKIPYMSVNGCSMFDGFVSEFDLRLIGSGAGH